MGGFGGGNHSCSRSLAKSDVTFRCFCKSAFAPTMKIIRSSEQFFLSSVRKDVRRVPLSRIMVAFIGRHTFQPSMDVVECGRVRDIVQQ